MDKNFDEIHKDYKDAKNRLKEIPEEIDNAVFRMDIGIDASEYIIELAAETAAKLDIIYETVDDMLEILSDEAGIIILNDTSLPVGLLNELSHITEPIIVG